MKVLDFIPYAQRQDVVQGETLYDCTADVQETINESIRVRDGVVDFGPGMFNIADTIPAGNGETFKTCRLIGAGPKYRGERAFSGTCINAYSMPADRPAIAVQGGRHSTVRGMSIIGRNRDHIVNRRLMHDSCVVDDLDINEWSAPGMTTGQHNPYAGIAIDPYAGDEPAADCYPGEYGACFSGRTLIEDCEINGFVAAVANQPCDADGNGDFTRIRDLLAYWNVYGISIGNSQSRNVELSNIELGFCHTGITNRAHGRQVGMFQGSIDNFTVHRAVRMFDLDMAYAGPQQLRHLYGEYMYRLGDVYPGSPNETALTVESGDVGFGAQNEIRGAPADIIGCDGGYPHRINLRGCKFRDYRSSIGIGGKAADIRCDDLLVRSRRSFDGVPMDETEKRWRNATSDGLTFRNLQSDSGAQEIRCDERMGGHVRAKRDASVCELRTRDQCYPLIAHRVDFRDTTVRLPDRSFALPKLLVESIKTEGTRVTIVLKDEQAPWQAVVQGPMPGDVTWDQDTGATCMVTERDGRVVICEQQTNIRNGEAITPIPLVGTHLYIGNSRFFSPKFPAMAHAVTGERTVRVSRDDEWAGYLEGEIKAGDYIHVDQWQNYWCDQSYARITDVSNAAQTITLDGPARKTCDLQLRFFIRP